MVNKAKKVTKPKIAKAKIVSNKKYGKYKNRVIKQLKKQLKKRFDTKKSEYLDDDDDDKYKGIRDIENLFDDDHIDNDYYKPILIKSSFNENC